MAKEIEITVAREQILKAYDQGWAAYGNDRPCESNPYRASVRLEQHNAWRKGWAECPAPGAEAGIW